MRTRRVCREDQRRDCSEEINFGFKSGKQPNTKRAHEELLASDSFVCPLNVAFLILSLPNPLHSHRYQSPSARGLCIRSDVFVRFSRCFQSKNGQIQSICGFNPCVWNSIFGLGKNTTQPIDFSGNYNIINL